MSSYKEETKHHHYNKQFQKKVEELPSVFRRVNGEFTAYSAGFASHKNVMCKNFSLA